MALQWYQIQPGSELFSLAFENWVFHELSAWNAYGRHEEELVYWQLTTGVEVDFLLVHARVAIEAKAVPHVHSDHLKGLRELVRDHPRFSRRIVVSLDSKPRTTEDGIEILPWLDFMSKLWSGEICQAL